MDVGQQARERNASEPFDQSTLRVFESTRQRVVDGALHETLGMIAAIPYDEERWFAERNVNVADANRRRIAAERPHRISALPKHEPRIAQAAEGLAKHDRIDFE